MKKDIWENVYYRLKDPVEIKLAILYTMKYVEIPISDIELKHFMLLATTVDFIELCTNLSDLFKENHIKTVWREDTEHYEMTRSGIEMIDIFENKIMASVRESLRNAIDEYYARKEEEAQIRCDITPINKDLYTVDIELKERKIPLLMMSVFAGSRQKAIAMKRHFKEKPLEIYTEILKLMTPKEDENE